MVNRKRTKSKTLFKINDVVIKIKECYPDHNNHSWDEILQAIKNDDSKWRNIDNLASKNRKLIDGDKSKGKKLSTNDKLNYISNDEQQKLYLALDQKNKLYQQYIYLNKQLKKFSGENTEQKKSCVNDNETSDVLDLCNNNNETFEANLIQLLNNQNISDNEWQNDSEKQIDITKIKDLVMNVIKHLSGNALIPSCTMVNLLIEELNMVKNGILGNTLCDKQNNELIDCDKSNNKEQLNTHIEKTLATENHIYYSKTFIDWANDKQIYDLPDPRSFYMPYAERMIDENDIKELEVTYCVKLMEQYFFDLRKNNPMIHYHEKIKDYLGKCFDVDMEKKRKLKRKFTNKELESFNELNINPYFKIKHMIDY